MNLIVEKWFRAGKWIGACLMGAAMGWMALAQAVSTTTVQGTVYLANGSREQGRCK